LTRPLVKTCSSPELGEEDDDDEAMEDEEDVGNDAWVMAFPRFAAAAIPF
jgi:hypothetical protein